MTSCRADYKKQVKTDSRGRVYNDQAKKVYTGNGAHLGPHPVRHPLRVSHPGPQWQRAPQTHTARERMRTCSSTSTQAPASTNSSGALKRHQQISSKILGIRFRTRTSLKDLIVSTFGERCWCWCCAQLREMVWVVLAPVLGTGVGCVCVQIFARDTWDMYCLRMFCTLIQVIKMAQSRIHTRSFAHKYRHARNCFALHWYCFG